MKIGNGETARLRVRIYRQDGRGFGMRRRHGGRQGLKLGFQQLLIGFVQLETFSAPQKGAILEHGEGCRVKSPVGALARTVRPPWHLKTTIFQSVQRIVSTLYVCVRAFVCVYIYITCNVNALNLWNSRFFLYKSVWMVRNMIYERDV